MGSHSESGRRYRSRFGKEDLELVQKMFENAPVAMGVLEGPDHRIQYMNRYLRELYGNRSFARGTPVREFWTAEEERNREKSSRLEELDRVYASGEPFLAYESKVRIDRNNDGKVEEGYFNFMYQPLSDEEVYGIFITGYEVTEYVMARQERAHSEKRLTFALEGADVGFWEVDLQNRTLDYASDQCKMHFGYSPGESFNYPKLYRAVHPEDLPGAKETVEKAVRGSGKYKNEYRVIWPDGSLHWLMSRGQCMYNEQGQPYRLIGITVDITRHRQATEKLKEAVRLRDDFLALASHELQTPVSSLKARAELFERKNRDAGNRQGVKQAEIINRHVDQLARLISRLLDITRLQADELRFEKELFRLDGLIGEIVGELRETSPHTIKIGELEESKVRADRGRIGEVLEHLLENAIKYSPASEDIVVRSRREDERVVVSVEDSGVGVSRKDRDKIFDRFYKGEDRRKITYPGFGMGLFISRQIVERHGGSIWMDDNAGQGSVFSFSLPTAGD